MLAQLDGEEVGDRERFIHTHMVVTLNPDILPPQPVPPLCTAETVRYVWIMRGASARRQLRPYSLMILGHLQGLIDTLLALLWARWE
jgi:hypothetical protein